MTTQIAFTLPKIEKKKALQEKLNSEWLTTKAFFNFCVDAYLNQQIKFWIFTNNFWKENDPEWLEESEKNKKAYKSSVEWKEESISLSEAKKLLLWNTK